MKSFKVYYINLDRSKDRRDFMEKQFSSLSIPITRISAINGAELSDLILRKARSEKNLFAHFSKLQAGEIGCFLSFIKSFTLANKQEEDFAILFEDDALIDKAFFDDLQDILKDINIDYFVDITGRAGFMNIASHNLINKFVVPPFRNTAQIIGKNAGKKLFENLQTYSAPIDVVLQDIYKHKVHIYSTKKKYVSHNDFNVGGTTAQNKNINISKKIIREIIRPFWQLVSFFVFKIKRAFLNFLFYRHKY